MGSYDEASVGTQQNPSLPAYRVPSRQNRYAGFDNPNSRHVPRRQQ